MFIPANGSVTHDLLDDSDGFVFGDQEAQDIRRGAIQLIPTGIPTLPEQLNWPKIEWTRADELPSFPDNIADRWHCIFNNQAIGTPQTFEFEPVSNFLDIDTQDGEYQWLRQKNGDGGLREVWPDNVDNAEGWVLQFRVQVIEDDTGLSKYHGHYIHIDDGTHQERIYVHEDGLFFENNPDLNIQYDLRSQPREIRIGGKQDDLYILLDDGRGFAALDGFAAASAAAELTFGTTGVDSHYRTLWDYVHVFTDELIVDTPPDVERVYSTDPVTITTPAFSPKKFVNRWVAAYLETSGDLVNGTTTITVQYRSSVATDWTEFGDFEVDEIGQFEILLDNVPTAEDGSDELRFLVTQESDDGTAEPARVEQITILAEYGTDGLRAVPHWGHRGGNNTVVLELNAASDNKFLAPSSGGERLLVPFDEDYVATVGSDTGIPSGTDDLTGGKFDQAVLLGERTGWDSRPIEPFFNMPPYGAVGEDVTPIAVGDLLLTETVVSEADGTVHPAQGAYGPAVGDGFSFPVAPNVRFLLEVNQGAVDVSDGTQTHRFYADDYWTAQPVAFIGLNSPVTLKAALAGSNWRAGLFQDFDITQGSLDFSESYGETGALGFAADVYVNLLAHGQQEILSTLDGNDGWEIGIAPGGFPYATIGDGTDTDTVTSLTPVVLERWTNLALNYRRFSDHTGLQILVDGAVAAEKITACTTVTEGLTLQAAPLPAALDQLRVHPAAIDAAEFSQDNGFTQPYFQNELAVPPDAENELVLRFYETGGAFADSSGKAHHAYAPTVGRRWIFRDRRFNGDRITSFWFGGGLKVLHTADQVLSLPHTVYGEMALTPNADFEQVIYEKWNSGKTVGFGIYLTTTGIIKVVVDDGVNEWTEYSTYLFADTAMRTFAVTVSSTQIVVRVDGNTDTFTHSTGSLAAANADASLGYGLMGYLRMLVVRNAALSTDDYEAWRTHESTWSPTDIVSVDGEALDAERVIHGGPTRKFVRMPPGEPGYVVIEVDSGGRVFFADRPYKYTYGYHRELPARIIEKVAGTKSPFRLVTEVPDDSINLAYVQQGDISVGQNVSTVDLSFKQAENLATYFGGDFLLHPPTTGLGGVLDYTGELDTENMLLSNRSAGWKDLSEPAPLFYRYQIGRGRFYVYQPNALSAADVQVIRNGIKIIADHGQPLPFEDFSWDIEVATVDIHGQDLPENVFSVTLFSTQKYVPGASVLVQYYAADALNDWKKIPSYLEIVNTQPIFTAVESGPGADEYALSLREDGTLDIEVGTL